MCEKMQITRSHGSVRVL